MTTDYRHDTITTDSDAWDIFVGDQTPRDFMQGETDAVDAVTAYAAGHPFWQDLSPEDGDEIQQRLVRYINDAR